MRKLLTLVILYTLISGFADTVFGQAYPLETNNWYFGNRAGIRFRPASPTNNPIALGDASTELAAGEGTTAISDTSGNLLFYVGTRTGNANYSTIFNKQHQRMAGGDSIIGGSSSSQNAIALRKPGSYTEYYVFSVAQLENYGTDRPKGFYYSKIDMTLNGGLGGVVPGEKNIEIVDSITEKISAVMHRNGRDVWVLSHRFENNEFVAVRLSAAGVSNPVITPIGVTHTDGPDVGRGCLKLSPNGNRFALAITQAFGSSYVVQVGKFNNLTGLVSDVFNIPIPDGGIFGPYGVEFSPDNSKLYVGNRSGDDEIYQYDLCADSLTGDSSLIIASKYTISTTYEPGTLQLGLDGKIYICKIGGTTLAAIGNPNKKGAACNYTVTAVQLAAGTTADRGLTNVNQSIFNDLAGRIEFTRLCERDTVQIRGQAQCQGIIAKYDWDFGDPASGDLNIDSSQITRHFYATTGTYRVKLRIVAGNLIDTVSEKVTITPLARGNAIFDELACKQSYRYDLEQDTANFPDVDITNYRWKVIGYVNGEDTATFEGVDKPNIEITWDSNQTARFSVLLETTTSLGEVCVSDTIPFTVLVNQHRGATPVGPDTLCFDPLVPFVITSPDMPRSKYQFVYTPSSDPAVIEGQGTDTVRIFPTIPGLKTIKTAFLLDTVNNICYTESATFKFFSAAAPSDSITVFGDSSICLMADQPNSLFRGLGRQPTSTIHWAFQNTLGDNATANFLTDIVNDTVRVRFDNLAFGRSKYFLQAQEVSKDGCLGPIRNKEVWNACIDFPNVVTPNGDGMNDVFKIGNAGNFPDNDITIFNRWGKKVFSGKSSNDPGNMNLAPGTYFYRLHIVWEAKSIERTGWFEVNK